MNNTMVARELQSEQDLAFMDEAVIMVRPHQSRPSTQNLLKLYRRYRP